MIIQQVIARYQHLIGTDLTIIMCDRSISVERPGDLFDDMVAWILNDQKIFERLAAEINFNLDKPGIVTATINSLTITR